MAVEVAGSEIESEDKYKNLFVVSPIGSIGSEERKHADLVFNALIKGVALDMGYMPSRADHVDKPGMITDHIINAVVDCDVCIADLSFLNPNVHYELGVRHYVGLPTIHIAAKGTKLPFDNMGARTIFFDLMDWDSQEAARKSIRNSLQEIQKEGYEASNPVTHAKAIRDVYRSTDPEDRILTDIIQRIEKIENISQSRKNNISDEYIIKDDSVEINMDSASGSVRQGINTIVDNVSGSGFINYESLKDIISMFGFPTQVKLFINSRINYKYDPHVRIDGNFIIIDFGVPF